MNGISVVICCYNSAERIGETIEFLANQNIPPDLEWEIVAVNNASTDSTKDVLYAYKNSLSPNLNLRVIDEPRPGLINARLRGIKESEYDVIVYCDDDNHLDKDYICLAYEVMREKPEVAIAGGVAKPKLPFYPGKWIESNYGSLAIGARGEKEGYVDWVFGAGMIIRKSIYQELGNKDIKLMLTGRLGKKQTSGDDAELCQVVRFLGYKIYYKPTLILHHKISPHRLSKKFFIKANYKNVFMFVYFFLLDELIKNRGGNVKQLYRKFFWKCAHGAFYFFPRILFGRNSFFSFIMFFQNFQLIGWLIARRRQFNNTFHLIRGNLYSGRENDHEL